MWRCGSMCVDATRPIEHILRKIIREELKRAS